MCILLAQKYSVINIRSGDNVKIGTNAIVISDISGNTTAVGMPAKVDKRGD